MNNTNDRSRMLKHFQDALAGRKLSWIAAHEINTALSGQHSYREYCSGDEKLPGIHRAALQAIVDRMIADGVAPAESLLTDHQKRAIERRKGIA